MRRRRHDETDFVARLRSGDEVAWAELYDELTGPIGGYARTKGIADTEDLIGEVFAAAAERIAAFEGDRAQLRSWLFTIAHHRLTDVHRKRVRRATDAAEPRSFDEVAEVDDAEQATVDRLDAAGALALLDELTADQREVVVLRVLGGLSVAETAAVLGRAEGAVKALQHRAINRLQRRIRGISGHPYPTSVSDDDIGGDRHE